MLFYHSPNKPPVGDIMCLINRKPRKYLQWPKKKKKKISTKETVRGMKPIVSKDLFPALFHGGWQSCSVWHARRLKWQMPALHSRKTCTSWDTVAYHHIAVNQTLAQWPTTTIQMGCESPFCWFRKKLTKFQWLWQTRKERFWELIRSGEKL